MSRAKRAGADQKDTIRLGCLDGWDISTFYPELSGILREKYPELRLSLDGYNHLSVVEALRNGAIDIAISLGIALQRQRDLTIQNITAAPAILLFAKSHPLSKKETVRLENFQDEPFYVIAPSAGGDNPMERLTVEICQAVARHG